MIGHVGFRTGSKLKFSDKTSLARNNDYVFYILSMTISQRQKKLSHDTLHLIKKIILKIILVGLKIILEFFSTEKITKIIQPFQSESLSARSCEKSYNFDNDNCHDNDNCP